MKRLASGIAWQYAPRWRKVAAGVGFLTLALAYLPILWLMVLSFSERPLTGVPWPLGLQWYEALAADQRWRDPMLSSLTLAAICGVIVALIATVVGRAIMRLERPGGVIALALMPLFVPGLAVGAALFLFFRSMLGLSLGHWSIIVGHALWALPFALLLILVILSRFDRRLLDAAADLGASPWQRFAWVEWPALRPAVFGGGLFGFLLSFSELPRSLFLRGAETTMPIFTWAQSSNHQSYVPLSFALATIIICVTIPLLVGFFLIAFRETGKR